MGYLPIMPETEWEALQGLLIAAYGLRSELPTEPLWVELVAGNQGIVAIPRTGWELFLWLSAFGRSSICNDDSRALIVHALVSDPERRLDRCHEIAGTKRGPGDVWYRYRRALGVETLAERSERLKPRPYVRERVYHDPDREAQRLLMEDPDARYRLGIAMGGRSQGRQI